MERYQDIFDSIVEGKLQAVEPLVDAYLAAGALPTELLNKWMIPAMDEVGARFEKGDLYVPEMLLSAHTMAVALKKIRPMLVDSGVEPAGKVLLATVKGDLHDIGKNLVGMMLEGAGFSIHDLGVNVEPGAIIHAIREEKPDVICLSALLTTTMTVMQTILEEIIRASLREQVKVVIGGAPVDQDYADEIGADGFGRDASQAVQVVRLLTSPVV